MNHQGSLQDTAIKYVSMLFSEKKLLQRILTFVNVIFAAVKAYTLKQESTLCWDGASHTRLLLVQPYTHC